MHQYNPYFIVVVTITESQNHLIKPSCFPGRDNVSGLVVSLQIFNVKKQPLLETTGKK